MKSFNDISVNILVIIIIVVLIELWYIYTSEKEELLDFIDDNDYTPISKAEFKKLLLDHYKSKKNKKADLNTFLKSTKSGVLRGCLMGLVTGGVGGAMVYGTVLGIINPCITGIEHIL
jgi:hypothetical protein